MHNSQSHSHSDHEGAALPVPFAMSLSKVLSAETSDEGRVADDTVGPSYGTEASGIRRGDSSW